MVETRHPARAFALLGLVMLFWAGNSIVGRAVRFDVPPFTLAFVRWWGALLFLAPFALAPLRRDWPAIRRGWKPVLLLGLLGIAAFNAFLYKGLHFTTATNALLLQAAIPALVVAFDRLFFGVRSGGWQAAGTAISTLGVLVIVFQGDWHKAAGLEFGAGDILVLGAVLVWAFYTVFLRFRPPISASSFIAVTFFIGALAMTPLAVGEWQAGETVRWSWGIAAAFVYVALLPSLLSYFIYNSAARTVGPAQAGQSITLMPVFGAFLAAALLDEALHSYHAVGIVLIIAGIGCSILGLRRQTSGGAAPDVGLED